MSIRWYQNTIKLWLNFQLLTGNISLVLLSHSLSNYETPDSSSTRDGFNFRIFYNKTDWWSHPINSIFSGHHRYLYWFNLNFDTVIKFKQICSLTEARTPLVEFRFSFPINLTTWHSESGPGHQLHNSVGWYFTQQYYKYSVFNEKTHINEEALVEEGTRALR